MFTRSGLACKSRVAAFGGLSLGGALRPQFRYSSSSSSPQPPPSQSTPTPPPPVSSDDGDIWSTTASDTATPPPPQAPPSPEVEELEKDKHFLYRLGVGMFGLGLCGVSLYYGLKVAKSRYMGEADSVRVGVETRGKPSLGGPFTLVSTDGVPVSQAEFLGKWTFFYFGFTHCPEICPVELNRMTRVTNDIQRERPAAPIQPLFISCDPKRDSIAAIKEYLSIFHPSFIGLVGTPNQVNEACKSYRIYYSLPDDTADEEADYLIDHSIAIFLFDPQGRFVDFFGNRYDAKEISEKVLGYIDKYTNDPSWTNY